MKTKSFFGWMLLFCLCCLSVGHVQAQHVYGPVNDPNFTLDEPDCSRVAVYGGAYPFGGQVTLRAANGETCGLYTNVTYSITWFFFIKNGTYTITDISMGASRRVMCNGQELKIGSVVTFSGGGYVGFFDN